MIPAVCNQQSTSDDDTPVASGTFIAVGTTSAQDEPVVMKSSNGESWTDVSAAAISASAVAMLQGIATDGSRWVAVGVDSNDLTTPVIITSDNAGTSWTARTPDPATNAFLFAVCWTGSMFIAVGTNGGSDPIVMTSPDGATWTQRTYAPATNVRPHCVAGISGLAVAGGWTSTNTPRIMSSTDDGLSWTQRTASPTSQRQLNGAAISAIPRAVIVALPTTGNTTSIQSSSDGTTWSTETGDPTTDVDLYGICHNETLFIAVGTDHALQIDPKVMTSPDGDTWTARTPDPVSGGAGGINLLGVAHGSNGFVVAVGRDQGFNDPFIMSSPDGIDWTERIPSPSTGVILNAVAGAA